jgi:hypothetical protein
LLSAFFQIDHNVALCLGGGNEKENLQALCPCCHSAKTHQDMKSLNAKFGKNFFMLFNFEGTEKWFRGVILDVLPKGYRVVFEDKDRRVVPFRLTTMPDRWVWV